MQWSPFYHAIILCHASKQLHYFQCKHGYNMTTGIQCKQCSLITPSKNMYQKHQLFHSETLQIGTLTFETF